MKPPSKPKLEVENGVASYKWPTLPHLRAALKKKPIVIVGGLVINEKIDLCQKRFGIELEWHETDGDAARAADTMAARIRAGGVSAVLILEGLISHKTSNKITDACKAKKIPYAMGDKGGVASLEAAFNMIEQKLAS